LGRQAIGLVKGWTEFTVGIRYKVVELSDVTDESIEEALNEWAAQGWKLDTMHFAMRESSRRPSMAFISFVQDVSDED
jgi:hypothetical protein